MVESIKELRKKCYTPECMPLFFGRTYAKFLRIFSIYFTKACLVLGISANQVTFISFIFGVAGCLFFIKGTYLNSIIGALLLQVMYVFDCVDGEIARYYKSPSQKDRGSSPKGWFIDSIPHKIIQPLIFICIGFGVYSKYSSLLIFALTFSAAISILLRENIIFTGHYIFFETLISGKKIVTQKKKSRVKVKTNKLMLFIKKIYDLVGDFFAFPTITNVILLVALFNILHVFILIYGIALPLIILVSFYYEYNFFVERLKERSKNILK